MKWIRKYAPPPFTYLASLFCSLLCTGLPDLQKPWGHFISKWINSGRGIQEKISSANMRRARQTLLLYVCLTHKMLDQGKLRTLEEIFLPPSFVLFLSPSPSFFHPYLIGINEPCYKEIWRSPSLIILLKDNTYMQNM